MERARVGLQFAVCWPQKMKANMAAHVDTIRPLKSSQRATMLLPLCYILTPFGKRQPLEEGYGIAPCGQPLAVVAERKG